MVNINNFNVEIYYHYYFIVIKLHTEWDILQFKKNKLSVLSPLPFFFNFNLATIGWCVGVGLFIGWNYSMVNQFLNWQTNNQQQCFVIN